jgi:hypothetical protein
VRACVFCCCWFWFVGPPPFLSGKSEEGVERSWG